MLQLTLLIIHCYFQSLKDNILYSIDDFINPIAKNIDIYALSLLIYKLFIGFNDGKIVNIKLFSEKIQIQRIIKALMRNALYNNINGPDELIIYLDGIINSMKDIYINNLRIKNKEQFYEYYDNYYTKKVVLKEGQNVVKEYYDLNM